ncbi:hypothetical protein C8R44DRAFT_743301 [Mycena epipterygia]|nr:hypothetical protein C8R44DRAFT_743301 [Mycena epipterygia]
MSYFNNEAEPYEEASCTSQGNRAPKTSPDELKAFYRDMERTDLERKLSKRKSSSLWSRKSLRRTSTSQSQQPAPAPSLTSPSTTSLARGLSRTVDDHDRGEKGDVVPPMPMSRSIVPDTLKELPTWYRDSAHHTVRYNMHNPVGPRWYKNHHLLPPSGSRPGTRPPSVFSPSFPPMAATGSQDRLEESTRMPNLTHSASNSPLPTPNSSQTRMEDAPNAPRSRKTSQTAHDTVDLLDGSDPWGTAWHHESPYDVGISSSPVSFEENPNNPNAPRSRTSSITTAQNRRKTVTPSPLSQSTSAVHLQVPEGAGHQLPRKLSKRRTVGIFGRHTVSAPASPVDEPNSRGPSPAHLNVPPRQGPPSSFVPVVTSKKDRRGSVLGRLAKRFSITRKPAPVIAMEVVRQPSPVKRQPSPEKQHTSEPIKRVPPPLVHEEESFVVVQPETSKVEADRSSSISLEADVAYTMGRLTVANPDPGSVESTPVQRERSLSPEEDKEPTIQHERRATDETLSVGPSNSYGRTLSSEGHSRSPEPIPSSAPVPRQHHSSERVTPSQSTSRTASPPPPPAPEKPSANSSNIGHRSRRSYSGPRTSVERSSSPPSNGRQVPSASTSTSFGTVQPPSAGNRLLEKPQPPPPSPPSPKLPAVPFPADYGPTPAPPPRELPHENYEMTADISPLSTSSMLVNPPTPYTPDSLMPDEPEPAPPPVPPKRSSRDPSPSQVSVTARETETFRLIRSSSGNVYASSETIRAAGEQWEVVESKSKGKNRSQDRESETRKEHRRQARAEKEADSEQKQRSERSRQRRSTEAGASTSQTFPRSDNTDRHQRSPIPDTLVSRQEEPRASRHKRDEERERKPERKTTEPKLNKPQPPAPAPSRPLERNPSKSARPISEVPTAADMNTMRAREAWDMDRLWKARSLSGMEPNGVAAAPMPPAPVSKGKSAEEPSAVYGSSHTAFMVSTPFQQTSSSQIYHSMPPAPPPVVYPAGYLASNGNSNTNRTPPSDRASSNSISPRPLLANPLPEPPRESPYEPAPLGLPEYWSKHAGVTTAH